MSTYQNVIYLFGVISCLTKHYECLSGTGVCHSVNKSEGINITEYYCCSGYEEIKNKCIECVGKIGFNCSDDCPKNYHGAMCKYKCDCTVDKYCDSKRGCVCNETSPNCTDTGTTETVPNATISTISTPKVDDQMIVALPMTVIGTVSLCFGAVILVRSCLCEKRKKVEETKNVPNGSEEQGNGNNTARSLIVLRPTASNMEDATVIYDQVDREVYNTLNLRVLHEKVSIYDIGVKPKPPILPKPVCIDGKYYPRRKRIPNKEYTIVELKKPLLDNGRNCPMNKENNSDTLSIQAPIRIPMPNISTDITEPSNLVNKEVKTRYSLAKNYFPADSRRDEFGLKNENELAVYGNIPKPNTSVLSQNSSTFNDLPSTKEDKQSNEPVLTDNEIGETAEQCGIGDKDANVSDYMNVYSDILESQQQCIGMNVMTISSGVNEKEVDCDTSSFNNNIYHILMPFPSHLDNDNSTNP